MKNFKLFAALLVVAVCTMFVTSCSKDDNKKDETSIIGKWNVTDVYYQGNWISASQAGYTGAYAQFNSDLTYVGHPDSQTTYNGTYVYKDNVATCKVGSDIVTYTIIELNGNTITAELNEFGVKTQFKAMRQ